MAESDIMADCARKRLVWDIKKDLLTLPADELFHIVKVIGPTPGKDTSELDLEDSEGCFEYIDALMSSVLASAANVPKAENCQNYTASDELKVENSNIVEI
ncbi:hypothetical protein DPX16_22132 [Anabarilius grahami]|uniref:Uncharacterized protein n=1 Tax=Anabarilius grahami TaxID=495550 RepID=A0A3N0XNK0_ANAGA|nr:hypothetical protein DPX16_22132 [Anabarilius grahami]